MNVTMVMADVITFAPTCTDRINAVAGKASILVQITGRVSVSEHFYFLLAKST